MTKLSTDSFDSNYSCNICDSCDSSASSDSCDRSNRSDSSDNKNCVTIFFLNFSSFFLMQKPLIVTKLKETQIVTIL